MPRASAADAAQTAQRILDSAKELFSVRGFSDVSVDDVARDAGVTRGAVYHHYRNKVALFDEVVAQLQADVARAVVAAAQRADAHPHEQLRAGSHAFLDAITDGAAMRILLVDAPAVTGWQEWRRLDAENSATHLREALRAAGIPEETLDASTAQLSGAMNEAALWTAQHDDTDLARQQSHEVLDRLLTAYVS
ncbi:TetR family transcriptional regulator [Microbacterium aurum]|uniref:TetR family transcriptional regulator n=1 Tax=Microbacterium aurum TaxID=36805 RepID=A0A1P8U9F7_9MICO|nr:TetR/AcrR family transcriptional regulator [Microbacterium aurum]APZ34761.1 TetR family transcriptional regulator [Microbacterium aurum]MBM7828667.1 AcrR family transcriptional regulator [Microbacterium aurum]